MSVRVFDSKATDFSSNGLGVLLPLTCTVTERLNGEYELTMTHPIDEGGKWKRLQIGNIVVAPVVHQPTQEEKLAQTGSFAPYTNLSCQEVRQYRKVRNVNTRSSAVPIYKDKQTVLRTLRNGARVWERWRMTDSGVEIFAPGNLGYDHYYETFAPMDYATGWSYVTYYLPGLVLKSESGFIRTECLFHHLYQTNASHLEVEGELSLPAFEQTARYRKDQPFRIYKVIRSLDKITVNARHIFYDFEKHVILNCDQDMFKTVPTEYEQYVNTPASVFCNAMTRLNTANLRGSGHKLTAAAGFFRKYDDDLEFDFSGKDLVDALLGSDGMASLFGLEVLRDGWNCYAFDRIGKDRGVTIREGKNLKSIAYEQDDSDIYTHILPYCTNAKGKRLYLDGTTNAPLSTVTSDGVTTSRALETYTLAVPNAGDYTAPRILYLEVNEADGKTTGKAVQMLRDAAQAEIDGGCGEAKVSCTVGFVNLADLEEYVDYKQLQGVFLGDTVHVIAPSIETAVDMRVTQYTYNCLTGKYDSVTLGEPQTISLGGGTTTIRTYSGGGGSVSYATENDLELILNS